MSDRVAFEGANIISESVVDSCAHTWHIISACSILSTRHAQATRPAFLGLRGFNLLAATCCHVHLDAS